MHKLIVSWENKSEITTVLSLKPLQILILNEDHYKLNQSLGSALFRRWIRLFIPLIVTTFIFMTLNYLIEGLSWKKAESAYHDEVWKWFTEFQDFSFVFRMGGEPWFSYNFHVSTPCCLVRGH